MKAKLVLFLCICLTSYQLAQETPLQAQRLNSRHGGWLLDFTTGANVDLIRSGTSPESGLLGSRPDVVPALGFRLIHLFSDKFGGYAKLHFNLYKRKGSEYTQPGMIGEILEAFADKVFWPVSRINPALDGGIIYRFEHDRWNIYPAIGIGYMYYLPDSKSSGTRIKNGTEYSVSYKQDASSVFLNTGVSVRYLFSYRGSLVFDVNFQQPLQSAHAELTSHTNGMETDRKSYRTSTAGRNVNISLGYGLTF